MDETEIAALTERVLSLPPAEQMGFVLGMLEKVSDERDGWKATVTRMMEDEEALIAERDRRLAELAHARTSAVVANDAADAAAEAVGAMAEKLTALLAERDRLRDERDMFRDQALPEAAMVLGALSVTLEDTAAERDRLWAVAAAAHELLDEDRTSWSPEHERLAAALAALDGSAETTDG